jgi:hypothetical protein
MAKHNNNILRIPTKMYRKADIDEVISVGFFVSKDFSPISWLIRKITKTPFSEIYFKFRDKKLKQGKIFYTNGINIEFLSENIFDKNNKTIAEFPIQVNKALHEEFLNECYKNAGIKYNVLQKVFKPKNRFNPKEWLFYLIEDKNQKWTETEPSKIKDKEFFDYLTTKKLEIKSNANQK